VEVAYALPDKQQIVALQVEPGCTAYQAAEKSGITRLFPELELEGARMGVFGKILRDPKAHVLEDADRVEIYRPLLVDPKESRRVRADKAKKAKENE
jgi:putative ubiquitin-RnfH superfamily antitoxin RatB of RatAB toxin-antitoxin module